MAETTNDHPTTIGADATFKGQLEFEKSVRLLGTFEGEINSGGELFVAEGAKLKGDMKLGSIRVEGEVKGNIDAKTRVQLTSSARLEGDVQAQRLEVEEGAVLIGRCVVGVTDQGKLPKAGNVQTATIPTSAVPMASKPKQPTPVPVGARK